MKFNRITLLLSIFIIFLSIGFVRANEDSLDLNQEIDDFGQEIKISSQNNIVNSFESEINVNEMNVDYSGVIGSNAINGTNTSLDINNITMYYKNGTRLSGSLLDENGTGIKNQNITIVLNGQNYVRDTDVNGTFSMAINLIPKIYNFTVIFNGTDIYNPSLTNATLTVLSTINGENITKFYRNDTQFYATFYDGNGTPLINTSVTFNINGVFYQRNTNGSGVARLNINLFPANYTLTAQNPNENLTWSYYIEVLPTILSEDIVKYYKNSTQYYATFLDKNGNLLNNSNVILSINDQNYTRTTDENGTVMFSINLAPGNYTLTAYNPDSEYSKYDKISVLSTLVANDISVKFQAGGQYSVKVVDGQGNPIANETVVLNIHGVFYTRTTDENGTAYLTINLNPGTYIITANHNDFNYSSKITVNKLTASISILTNPVAQNDYLRAQFTVSGTTTPIAGRMIYFIYNDTAYQAVTDAEGIGSARIGLSPGSYQIITAIQEDDFYDNIASYNTIVVT